MRFLLALLFMFAPGVHAEEALCGDLLVAAIHQRIDQMGYRGVDVHRYKNVRFANFRDDLLDGPLTPEDRGSRRHWNEEVSQALESVDPRYAELLLRYLRVNQIGDSEISAKDEATILRMLPVWAPSAQGLEIAELLFAISHRTVDAVALERALPFAARAAFRASVKQSTWAYFSRWAPNGSAEELLSMESDWLRLISNVPWPWIDERVRESLNALWQIETYPALRLDAIRPIVRGEHPAGECPDMTHNYIAALGLRDVFAIPDEIRAYVRESYNTQTLIRMRGEIIGLVKNDGDRSMLALRNVVDDEGRRLFVLGGVYELSEDALEKIGPRPAKTEDFQVIDFEELGVKSLTFLINYRAWNSRLRHFVAFIGGYDLRTEYADRADLQADVWRKFLRQLALKQRRLQRLYGAQCTKSK